MTHIRASWAILQYLQLLRLCDAFAVEAFEERLALVDGPEFGEHRLVVGDALRVAAFGRADDLVRQLQLHLLAHLVVLDDVDLRGWGGDGDLVHLRLGEVFVGHFDDGFLPEALALQVVAEGDLVRKVLQAEDGDDLEQFLRWYVVDDGPVLQGGDLQLFCSFFFFHVAHY